jgi:hypothetical protein
MNLLHAAPPEYVGIYLSKAFLFAAISMKTIRDRLDTPSFTLCYHYNTDEFMKIESRLTLIPRTWLYDL